MDGHQERTGPLFSSVSTEGRIPNARHLRQVRRLGDQALDRLNPTFSKLYAEAGPPLNSAGATPAGLVAAGHLCPLASNRSSVE
jgi:hypothetical protein